MKVKNNNYQSFEVKPQRYKAADYHVEGDASAASYWTSMAYLHDGNVSFSNLKEGFLSKKVVHKAKKASDSGKTEILNKKSIQGDASYTKIFKKLGKGEFDMNDMPDVAMTAAVISTFENGQTKIAGLSTLRIKETDRLAALENELKKVGVKVRTTKDSITVQGLRTKDYGLSRNTTIQTYNDHRMAMCFAVMGTKIPGIVIENPECTDKTYPKFWEDLERVFI